jgi:hypothetical protein
MIFNMLNIPYREQIEALIKISKAVASDICLEDCES